MKSFSKREAFVVAWQTFKERPLFIIGLFIITIVISSVMSSLAHHAVGGSLVLLNVLDFAVQILLGMGMTLILIRIYDNADTGYRDFFEPIPLFVSYIIATILTTIIVSIGFLLLVIPGIVASIALMFVPYLIIDRNMGPIEAIKESVNLSKGHMWNLLMLGLLIIGLNVVGVLAFGIGLLVTIPVSALAVVHVYRWLLNPKDDEGIVVSNSAKAFSAFVIVVLLTGSIIGLSIVGQSLSTNSQSRDAIRKSDFANIQTALSIYKKENGEFPPRLQLLTPKYMSSIPVDPKSKLPYQYVIYGGRVDYQLCTQLESSPKTQGVYCVFGLTK